MSLRPYQEKCVSKVIWSLTLEGNSVVSAAQGAGKTHIIAEIPRRLNEPILILVPSKELLEQDLSKLKQTVDENEIGVFSASMNSKVIKKYTIGTIQSVHKHPELFGHYKVVIVDECHNIDPKNMDGMYNSFFKAIGNPKVIGLSATPFRLGVIYQKWGPQKWMCNTKTVTKMINRSRSRFWSRIIEVVNIKDLQDQGFLVPMTYHDVSIVEHEELPTNKSKSEFDLEKFELAVCNRYTDIANFIKELPHKKKLVFCSSVSQAETVSRLITGSRVVTAETPSKERHKAIEDYRSGVYETLVGVNIFSIGFDVPSIDCIVSLRPTRSLVLWSQVLGRGSRLSPGKTTCHIYDLVGNIRSLGKFESMEIKKVDEKWNVVTDTRPNGWHDETLFEYRLKPPKDLQPKLTDNLQDGF